MILIFNTITVVLQLFSLKHSLERVDVIAVYGLLEVPPTPNRPVYKYYMRPWSQLTLVGFRSSRHLEFSPYHWLVRNTSI